MGKRGEFPLSPLASRLSPRRGFTLVELLVVIAIVAVLAGLIAVAGMSFVEQAQTAATRTTIKKVDEAILNRVSAIDRFHELEPERLRESWEQRGWLARWANYGVPPRVVRGNIPADTRSKWQRVLKMLSRKEAIKEMFPITPTELKRCYWFWGRFETNGTREQGLIPPNDIPLSAAEQTNMQAFLDDMDLDPSNNNQSLDRPGEIILYALKNAPVFGGLPLTADDFEQSELSTQSEQTDRDGDGVPELVDAWGQPLRFYRWPTRLVNYDKWSTSADYADVPRETLMPNAPAEPQNSNQPNKLKRDPDDPLAFLARTGLTRIFHDPLTWHAPLVVSSGPDLELGLAEPSANLPVTIGGNTFNRFGLAKPLSAGATTAQERQKQNGYLYDNVTNHNGTGGL